MSNEFVEDNKTLNISSFKTPCFWEFEPNKAKKILDRIGVNNNII